jgi:hypothetical protein
LLRSWHDPDLLDVAFGAIQCNDGLLFKLAHWKAVLMTPNGTVNNGAYANFADYEKKLFELYTRFRYNELICHKLREGATKLEKMVQWSVLILLAITLFTGVFPVLGRPGLEPVWKTADVLATLLALYAMIQGSEEKQFRWFRLGSRFYSRADEVEFFSFYVQKGRILETELKERWAAFSKDLKDLVEDSGTELTEYEGKHKASLTKEINDILTAEKAQK